MIMGNSDMRLENSNQPILPIIIVDDDLVTLRLYDALLKDCCSNAVISCQDSREVLSLLRKGSFSLMLLDLNMPYITGQELLKQVREEYPELPVIIITGEDNVNIAVKCMKMGALVVLI